MKSQVGRSLTVLTIVAGEGQTLNQLHIDDLARKLACLNIVWLDQDRAVDLFCSEGVHDQDLHDITHVFSDMACDFFIQPAHNRRKQLLVADMESTIIKQEMLDELADVIGLRDRVSDITQRAMNGQLDFRSALRERVGLLREQPTTILDKVAQQITLMPGAEQLVSTMKASGAQCWLVSGGFTFFANRVGSRLGFNRVYANELVIKNGSITGEVADPILDKNAKKEILEQACSELGVSLSLSLAVGDGANDVPMLAYSNSGQGLGVAFYAKPNVRSVIPCQINHGNLTALLFAQGYFRDEFISS